MLEFFFLYSSLFFSQFYILPSGLPQISHFLILMGFLVVIYKGVPLYFNISCKIFFIFLIYVSVINIFWAVFSVSETYLISLMYWIFNFSTFLYIVNVNKINLKYFDYIILASYLILLIGYALSLGRFDFHPRYNGFFNDPNQMAFWVLCTLSISFIGLNNLKLPILFLAIILILLTMSRSAIIGLFFVVLGFFIQEQFNVRQLLNKLTLIVLFIFGLFFIYIYYNEKFESVVSRFEEADIGDQADIRGYTALIKFPEYLIFGAGQGQYDRFSETGHEIHSTWAGLLFYYGIVGTLIFLSFLFSILSRLPLQKKIIFLGPLFYGFSTYGLRTSIVWFYIAIYFLYAYKKIQLK